jgi:hypothetical protein
MTHECDIIKPQPEKIMPRGPKQDQTQQKSTEDVPK